MKFMHIAIVAFSLAVQMLASEPEWNGARVKDCHRECLVGFMNGYMNAVYKHDPKAVSPLAIGYRMTENTGHKNVGEGMLWLATVEPTPFQIYIADPVTAQVGLQARLKITPQGQQQLKFSMLTCRQQIDTKIFAYLKHIRPRHATIIDQQKGVVTMFVLFVHDGTRRGAPDAPPGMLISAMIVESFGIRGGKIHEVEAMPFVTIPYGLGDGWTEGSGR